MLCVLCEAAEPVTFEIPVTFEAAEPVTFSMYFSVNGSKMESENEEEMNKEIRDLGMLYMSMLCENQTVTKENETQSWETRNLGMLCSYVSKVKRTRTRRHDGPNDDGMMMPIMMRSDSHGPGLLKGHETVFYVGILAINAVCALSCIAHMMNQGHGYGSSRNPPSWAPDMEPRYTFAMWQRDVLLWTIANSDLDPHRQAALLLQQLRGGARELTRDLPMNVIMNGALLNGVQVDGVTYIMNVLAERYGQLGEELRLKVIREFMDFDRKQQENIDDLLTRFEVVRHRATDIGNFDMSFEGISYMLLRACRVTDQQFIMLTQPTNGRLPNAEPEYRNLFGALRRLGHVLEHHQDNIAAGLRLKGSGKGNQGHYHTNDTPADDGPPTDKMYPQWNVGDSWSGNGDSWTEDPWTSGPSTSGPSNSDGWNLGEWPDHLYHGNEEIDSGTDTDTVSSTGEVWYEYDDIPEGLDENQQAEELFWAYQAGTAGS